MKTPTARCADGLYVEAGDPALPDRHVPVALRQRQFGAADLQGFGVVEKVQLLSLIPAHVTDAELWANSWYCPTII
ncbi:hypothetical protein AB0N81_10575 [Streptomyces sp. NPDC093510]|uniref:hypothetical protein n=1 Tax=Streptomyces sp. NPDC093510 TaxID=3155199 RepID=UPI00341FA43F